MLTDCDQRAISREEEEEKQKLKKKMIVIDLIERPRSMPRLLERTIIIECKLLGHGA